MSGQMNLVASLGIFQAFEMEFRSEKQLTSTNIKRSENLIMYGLGYENMNILLVYNFRRKKNSRIIRRNIFHDILSISHQLSFQLSFA